MPFTTHGMHRVSVLSCQLVASSTAKVAAQLSELLLGAWSDPSGKERDPLTDVRLLPPLGSLSDAVAVHDTLFSAQAAQRLGGIGGYKLGWKNNFKEVHALYSPVFAAGILPNGVSVSLAMHKVFSAEAEFGLTLSKRLEPRSTPYTQAEVWAAVGHIELCIELCGVRQTVSQDRLHYVADALMGACIVRGPKIPLPSDPAELTRARVRLIIAGIEQPVAAGRNGFATCNPCDSPLASLTFMVNDLCVRRKKPLEAGLLIITGHCCQAKFQGRPAPFFVELPEAKWESGDIIRADFDGLGSVHASLLD